MVKTNFEFDYIIEERARAIALDYPDPINEDFTATSEMYHRLVYLNYFPLKGL